MVTVSSGAHRAGRIDLADLNWERRRYRRWEAYGQSKLANLLFTLELERRLTAVGSPVRALAAHPGYSATNLQFHYGNKVVDRIMGLVNRIVAQSAAMGALPTVYAATQDLPGGSYVGPDGRRELHGYPTLVGRSAAASDIAMAQRLWDRVGGAHRSPVPDRDHRVVTTRSCRLPDRPIVVQLLLRSTHVWWWNRSAAGDTFWPSTPGARSAVGAGNDARRRRETLMLRALPRTLATNHRRIRAPGVPGGRPAGRPGRRRTGGRHPRRHRLPGHASHLGADRRHDRQGPDRGPRRHPAAVRGRDPRACSTNGIGAGRDMIIIEASDLPGRNVISAGGGIWAGMSGSPVYIDGKLLGAVSYGFSASPSPIGGVTPAADMLDLLEPAELDRRRAGRPPPRRRPTRSRCRRPTAGRSPPGPTAAVPARLAGGAAGADVAERPVGRAGVPLPGRGRRRRAVGDRVRGEQGGRPRPRPRWPGRTAGGNFGAALSYGDLTTAGLRHHHRDLRRRGAGLRTPVQVRRAGELRGQRRQLAGHRQGQHLRVVQDGQRRRPVRHGRPGPAGRHPGRPDPDPGADPDPEHDPQPRHREAAAGPDAGRGPRPAAVASPPSGCWPTTTSIFDEIGDGRASHDWTITGRRAGNKPFTVSRGNKFASSDGRQRSRRRSTRRRGRGAADQRVRAGHHRPGQRAVRRSPPTYRHWTITTMAVSVERRARSPRRGAAGQGRAPRCGSGSPCGRTSSTTLKTTTLTMTVPTNAKGRAGSLLVTGGAELAQGGDEEEGCLIAPELCEEQTESSLDALISGIAKDWRNDEVAARLVLDPTDGGTSVLRRTTKKRQTDVVYGEKELTIEVR